jgi:hypothetical protein
MLQEDIVDSGLRVQILFGSGLVQPVARLVIQNSVNQFLHSLGSRCAERLFREYFQSLYRRIILFPIANSWRKGRFDTFLRFVMCHHRSLITSEVVFEPQTAALGDFPQPC